MPPSNRISEILRSNLEKIRSQSATIAAPPVWRISEGIELLQSIEPSMKAVGAHVGLTGGTLFRGWSSKDLDVIVYPHTTSNPPTLEQIRQVFAEAGFFQSTTEGDQPNPPVHPSRPIKNATDASGKALGRITNREGDNKIITIWSDANGRRIDVFFLDFPDKWFTQEV